MASRDEELRRQCQGLLQRLKFQQSELKVMIPGTSSTHQEPSSNNLYNHRSDLKPEYARDKLRSVVRSTDRGEEQTSYSGSRYNGNQTRPSYTKVANSLLNETSSRRHVGSLGSEGFSGVGRDVPAEPSYTTDGNAASGQTYSCGYTTTPRTRRRRELIDRNVKVDSRLSSSEDVDTGDRLNFSYSDVMDDDMTFLKSALNQSPEEVFQDVSDRRVNDEWRAGKSDSVRFGDTRWEDIRWEDRRGGLPEEGDGGSGVPSAAMDSEVTYAKQLVDEGNNKEMAGFVRETVTRPRSVLTSNDTTLSRSRNKTSTKVSFRSSADSSSVIRRESQKKMLGYDWIAALLDNDKDVIDESEAYFEDLKEFRRVNREECSNMVYMEGPVSLAATREPSPVAKAISDTKVKPYMVNERLFTVPIKKCLLEDFKGGTEEEGEQKEPKKKPTAEDPRFVRVSIPRSTLETPYRFKPHRRNSFDPTDSCGLREHCLLGWENSRPAMMPAASNLGISDATHGITSKMATTLADAERLASSYEWAFPQATTHRPDMFPSWRKGYQDSVVNLSNANVTRPPGCANFTQSLGSSSLSAGSEGLRKTTNDLLNSTYSMMYEMERLKRERAMAPQTQAKGVA
ncbi:uncharacterized protein LOC124117742 [Haliotis rufescens]|uniref:uncharacterized protein LOC124117742 n=1 Tax=Haliotis rufescens TaxID=6454 RepID=UPI00201FA6F8|nr:uncharacterized protein LOC124117742 [Haliotis rufescens]XP_046335688.2 uncharacterized protein LOC124117742 [Haliotis rufescens]XP_046335693.2 uncharacterized protein LOC124117742 [Haliotis rufescens]